jgi:hypothetical protein
MSSWICATVPGDVWLVLNRACHWNTYVTQDLVPEGLLNHREALCSTFPKTGTCSFLRSIVKFPTGHIHDSTQTRVKTAHFHPATCNLAHWLTRHGSPTIYRCFELPQFLYRWRHQFGIFSIPPRIFRFVEVSVFHSTMRVV